MANCHQAAASSQASKRSAASAANAPRRLGLVGHVGPARTRVVRQIGWLSPAGVPQRGEHPARAPRAGTGQAAPPPRRGSACARNGKHPRGRPPGTPAARAPPDREPPPPGPGLTRKAAAKGGYSKSRPRIQATSSASRHAGGSGASRSRITSPTLRNGVPDREPATNRRMLSEMNNGFPPVRACKSAIVSTGPKSSSFSVLITADQGVIADHAAGVTGTPAARNDR